MSFASETTVKATRKRHLCVGCGTHIEVGSPAVRWAGMTDGDFSAVIYHTECRAAEIALNRQMDLNWDEWCALEEMEDEDWPWLVDAFPVVAKRMGITLPTSSASQSPEGLPRRSAQDEPLQSLPHKEGEGNV